MISPNSVSKEYEKPERSDSDVGRVFTSGVRVGRTSYGLGVFSFALIPQGTPIGRVPGKLIHDPDYGSDYCISAGEGSVLEPGPPFCYLNHSCEPNCQLMQYVREADMKEGEKDDEDLEIGELSEAEMSFEDDEEFEDDDCFYGEGAAAELDDEYDEIEDGDEDNDEFEMEFEDDADAEIWVEAVRDIMPGEELTIDYAWPADRAMKCLCGTPSCRGWIVDPVELHLLDD